MKPRLACLRFENPLRLIGRYLRSEIERRIGRLSRWRILDRTPTSIVTGRAGRAKGDGEEAGLEADAAAPHRELESPR
jgi:hypothetical protein